MCVRVCVWVCGCDFIGLYLREKKKRYMIFHLFNSYQRNLLINTVGRIPTEYPKCFKSQGDAWMEEQN